MKPALVIYPTGTPFSVIDLDRNDTLETLQELVGGYVESLTLTPKCVLWCNEYGITERLQTNVLASLVMQKAFWPRVSKDAVILGTAILTGGADENGEILPVDFDDLYTQFGIEVTRENV